MKARPTTLSIDEAALTLGTVMILLIAVSMFAVQLGLAGIVVVQVIAIGTPPLVVAYRVAGSRRGVAELLGLRRPRARALIGATLAGVSFWYVNLWLVMPISMKLFGGREELTRLQETFFGGGLPTILVLAIVSVTPAICEELLHRGAITRAIHARRGPVFAVVVSALLFGLMHIQLVRLLPATAFGLVLGYATVVSGTIVPSMLMHFLNNAVAVLLASGSLAGPTRALTEHPNGIGVGALACCGLGLWLLWSAGPSTPDGPRSADASRSATSP